MILISTELGEYSRMVGSNISIVKGGNETGKLRSPLGGASQTRSSDVDRAAILGQRDIGGGL